MMTYNVEVYFGNNDKPNLVWYMESPSSELLIVDVVEKLRTWMGAKGLYLKKIDVGEWTMMLVVIPLGTVTIIVDKPDDDDS